ncbi:MAG: sodium:solute symporter, partial [Candidatus Neomarinimicrobiota bacterium]
MQLIDFAIIALYLSAIVFVGLFLRRKAAKGIDAYFLGNRNLPWWVLGSSGMASNLDISGTMIIVALIYALGAKGFFIEIRGGVTLIMAFLMIFM